MCTFTSGSAVTWGLSGPGTLSTTEPSTSTVYTAPSGVASPNTLLGVPVTPKDSIFNADLMNVPQDTTPGRNTQSSGGYSDRSGNPYHLARRNNRGEILTLGSGTAPAGQPIFVVATNGRYLATTTLYTAGTPYLFKNHQ